MRILHTSDWHLGKRLYGVSRIEEQAAVLEEIAAIADSENVDVVLVAGDIFDTAVPSAAAESLFYEAALRLSHGRRLVAVAGNHDDAQRFAAPSPLSSACGIVLVGERLSAADIQRYAAPSPYLLPLTVNNERLNLLCFPYLSPATAAALSDMTEAAYPAQLEALMKAAAKDFQSGAVNIVMTHQFFMGGLVSPDEERYLGSAQLLPLSALPAAAYTALGHIHKPMCLSKERRIYYSGSPLLYSFDERTEKQVLLIDTDGTEVTVTPVPLKSGKKLVRITADSAEQAVAALDAAGDVFAEVVLTLSAPLLTSETRALKKYKSCVCIRVEAAETASDAVPRRRDLSDAELFKLFYLRRAGKEPDDQTTGLFLSLIGEGGQ